LVDLCAILWKNLNELDEFDMFIKIVVVYLDLMLRKPVYEKHKNKQFKKILDKFGYFFT